VAARPNRVRDAEVLDVAAGVFARRGYAAATVQDVADELGILKGSIYYYIKSKEDLLFRLITEVHEEVDALLAELDTVEGLDPLQRIAAYVRAQAEYNLRNGVRMSVYYNDMDQLSDERRKEVLRRRKAHENHMLDLVLDAQRAKLIDPGRDPRMLTFHIFAVTIWPYRWYTPRGRIRLDDVVESCVEFVVGGLTRA
jgi:AcrR family transcriptional regulator